MQGAYNVVPIREMILEIIKLALRKTNIASSLDEYKAAILSYLKSEGFNNEEDGDDAVNIQQKTQDIIATSVFACRDQIQETLT